MQGAGHEFNALKTKFLDGNNRYNRRILDKRNKLPGHGRHDALEGLRQDDVPHLLVAGKSQSMGCFPLSPADGLDSRSDDFGNVGTLKYCQCYECGGKCGDVPGFGKQHRQDILTRRGRE